MQFLLTWLPTIIVFILMLAVLVLAHEFGHFIMAKRAGMTVEEFGFGFPPRLFGKKWRGTLYSFNLLPLGGFVRILGEGEESHDKGAFGNKPIMARLAVIVAGVIMNILLAYVAVAISFWAMMPPIVTMTNPTQYGGRVVAGSGDSQIRDIATGSLAEKNDIRAGDIILSLNNTEEPNVIDVRSTMLANKGGDIHLKIKRGEEIFEKNIAVGDSDVLGVGLGYNIKKVRYVWWQVPYWALLETGKILQLTVLGIVGLFSSLFVSHVVPDEVGGPVAIFGITSVVVQLGFTYILALLINLSMSLAVINILPFPALDGGRLVFLIVEKLRGRRVAQKVETAIHNLGFILLLALLVLLTWRDVARF